jgi:hypothetical protein
LANAYQKIGMFGMPGIPFADPPFADRQPQGDQVRGFGFLHDGGIATVRDFLHASVFSLDETSRQNLEQFVHAFDTTFAPIVGQQITLTSTNAAAVGPRIDLLIARARTSFTLVGQSGAHECDLVVKCTVDGEARGYLLNASTGQFRSDRASEATLSDATLRALANTAGQELTYTCAPPGSGVRMGIDRDEDGYLDRDELDAGSDPADPNSVPGTPSATATRTPQPSPTGTPSSSPTSTPSSSPTSTPPPSPTGTPSSSPSTAPPSPTGTSPSSPTSTPPSSPTSTPPSSPTATMTHIGGICSGDCDGNGSVGIDDLIRGVAIALDQQPLAACASLDTNGDGHVDIGELVAAVAAALHGCILHG